MPQFRPSEFPVGDSLALQTPAVPGYSNVLVGTGVSGARGKSAYEVAVDNGFDGTERDWLLSLRQGLVSFQTVRYIGTGFVSSFSVPGFVSTSDSPSSFIVSINGILQEPYVDYSLDTASRTLALDEPLKLGDKLVVTRPIILPSLVTFTAEQIGAVPLSSLTNESTRRQEADNGLLALMLALT